MTNLLDEIALADEVELDGFGIERYGTVVAPAVRAELSHSRVDT